MDKASFFKEFPVSSMKKNPLSTLSTTWLLVVKCQEQIQWMIVVVIANMFKIEQEKTLYKKPKIIVVLFFFPKK